MLLDRPTRIAIHVWVLALIVLAVAVAVQAWNNAGRAAPRAAQVWNVCEGTGGEVVALTAGGEVRPLDCGDVYVHPHAVTAGSAFVLSRQARFSRGDCYPAGATAELRQDADLMVWTIDRCPRT